MQTPGGKRMCGVSDEIDRAIESLQLKGSVRKVSRVEAEEINRMVLVQFAGGKDRRRWWESFLHSESVSFDDDLVFQRIPSLVPDAGERCWFIAESPERGPYPVYEASPQQASGIIGECFGFEYYIVPKDLSWLICENHHASVIGCGVAVEEAIRRLAAQPFAAGSTVLTGPDLKR
ncbi:MAG: hypothetical protein IPK97_16685 [Ahniella sp.]|nr:hypothetical protein [Ahniella sp.]